MSEKNLKKLDAALLVFFPIFGAAASLVFGVNYLAAIFLFFAPSCLWFSYRTRRMAKRTLIFSAVAALPFATVINYLAVLNNAWFVTESIFPRFLGLIPIEDYILGAFLIYNVIIIYEHFLEKGRHKLVDHKLKYYIWPWMLLFILFFAAYFINPEFLIIDYAYSILGIVFLLVPVITMLSVFPRLVSKYAKIGSYFFFVTALFELTGLELKYWYFPGRQFIGWLNVYGYEIPYEEFFFWFIMTSITIISYYEFFADDRQ